MIFDHLSRAAMYEGVNPRLQHAFSFLRRTDLATLAVGRYDLVGADIFALVQDYVTKPTELGEWESHRKYIDVQFLVAGTERMGHGYVDSGFTVSQEYDETRDYILYTGSGNELVMTPGMFTILWPHDVHRPSVAVGAPSAVRKIVVKIRVD
jgi:biofilm protein TabA